MSSLFPLFLAVFLAACGSDNPIFFKSPNVGGGSDPNPNALKVSGGVASRLPAIAASGSLIYVAWEEGGEIFLAISNDGGGSFGEPVNLSNSTTFSSGPSLAATGETLFLAWEESREGPSNQPSNSDIFFKASNNGGATFGLPLNLVVANRSTLDTQTAPQHNPVVSFLPPASSGQAVSVFVAWEEWSGTLAADPEHPQLPGTFALKDSEIFLARSADGGATFSDATKVTSHKAGAETISADPTLAGFGSTLYIAWGENLPSTTQTVIYFRKFDNQTLKFSPLENTLPIQAASSGKLTGPAGPSLAASSAGVFLAFEGFPTSGSCTQTQDVFFSRAPLTVSKPADFSPPDNISLNCGRSRGASLAASPSGTGVAVVWEDATFENPGVLSRKSSDSGAAFGATANLSGGGSSINPAAAARSDGFAAAWEDSSTGVPRILALPF